jgi:iron complex transport system substrate-binding protein
VRSSTHAILAGLTLVAILMMVWGVAQTSKPRGASAVASHFASEACIADASGTCIAVGPYRRIASCSAVADAILPDLVEIGRVVATTRFYFENSPLGFRWTDRAHLDGPQQLEQLLTLQPDMVLVSEGARESHALQRLRERGIRVFDLGPMLGQAMVERNMLALAKLFGVAGRGEQLALDFRTRLARVAVNIPLGQRKRAVFVDLYDTQLYGGTLGSSYHDVLSHAGLIDIAANRHVAVPSLGGQRAWPHYRPEDLLLLDPDVIVTTTGKTQPLCNLPGLSRLRACSTAKVIELPVALIGDAGPGMLHAAEELHRRVYGSTT